MSNIPNELHYVASHEWAKLEDDGLVRVGISDFAQGQLGDVVFVELPTLGRLVNAGEACAVIESVKAASDIFSPVSGEVIAVNEALTDTPELVNADSYAHWLFLLKPNDPADVGKLLTAEDYASATGDA